MRTVCPECNQNYRIKENNVGLNARCRKCHTVFKVKPLITEPEITPLHEDGNARDEGKKRRTPTDKMMEKVAHIREEINDILPELEMSLDRGDNESDTRMLIDRILTSTLGYKIPDIRTEQKIEGRKADYVLETGGDDNLIIEAKKIGMSLKATQLFQATSYAAHSGIPWVVLTNAMVWQLYRVILEDKITTELVFTIDLKDGLDGDEAYCFYLISAWGMQRKGLLEKAWREMSALCQDNILTIIVSDTVITRIRTNINSKFRVNLDNDRVREAVESLVYQLS